MIKVHCNLLRFVIYMPSVSMIILCVLKEQKFSTICKADLYPFKYIRSQSLILWFTSSILLLTLCFIGLPVSKSGRLVFPTMTEDLSNLFSSLCIIDLKLIFYVIYLKLFFYSYYVVFYNPTIALCLKLQDCYSSFLWIGLSEIFIVLSLL